MSLLHRDCRAVPPLLPVSAAVVRHATGLVDGWRATGRTPSEAMFRAAFMATSRLGLPPDQAAAAMLQLLRESFEVGVGPAARCAGPSAVQCCT